jgi:hypothetical protein
MKIDFTEFYHCPKCDGPMVVLMPIWILPGGEPDDDEVEFDSDNPLDAKNWQCDCGYRGYPKELELQ